VLDDEIGWGRHGMAPVCTAEYVLEGLENVVAAHVYPCQETQNMGDCRGGNDSRATEAEDKVKRESAQK
jgi:hypothetical protein